MQFSVASKVANLSAKIIVSFHCQLPFRVRETCDRFEIDESAKQQQPTSHNRRYRDANDSSDDSSSTSSSSDFESAVPPSYAIELKKQNELSNNLTLHGIPQIRDENLRGIFLKLCKLLGAQISGTDIKSIRRDYPRTVITVELWSHNKKMHVARCSHSNYIWSDEVIRLPPGIMRNRIYINDQMTHFYREMWEMARDARKKKYIQTSWITDQGYMVKRTATSGKRYFLSPRDLANYINKIRNAENNRHKKRRSQRSESFSSEFGTVKRQRLNHGR